MREMLTANPLLVSIGVSFLWVSFLHIFFQAMIIVEVRALNMNRYLKKEVIARSFFCGLKIKIVLVTGIFSYAIYPILTAGNDMASTLFVIFELTLFLLGLCGHSMLVMTRMLDWAKGVDCSTKKGGMIRCCKQMVDDQYSIILIEGSDDDAKEVEYPLAQEAFQRIEKAGKKFFLSPVVAFADPERENKIVFLDFEISSRKSNYAVL